MHKMITGLFLLVITFSAYSNEKVPAGLNDYITNLVNEASITLNNSSLSQEAKISKARELIYNNLDFNWMARYTLGRNGVKTLSNEQIREFIKIYSKYVTKAYTDLIKDYKGAKPKIVGVRALNSTDFMVAMNIISNKGQDPIKVEYLIREMKKDGKGFFKVSDIITEGISLIGAQQDEFTNTLKNEGFDQLIQNLQSRS
ncbi:MlaC/ttg2D family ABC transporter substrate-binding protein [Rickettsia canadensis]|uniref:Aspartate aminotransferase n=1 Tax=Rickettsia canadensis str. CA410 TaxID=1105107 RepID=A0ABM5MSY0_RICCA|nr:phospholipid-binding protein MlaC [Rickettsia canadensis]AFB20666.1 aspartate aminotransferase [Rickettsia canadensis str. CA410]